jgi:hypothetical protein
MVNREKWRTDADGCLSAVISGLRLVVRKSDCGARYAVLQRANHNGSSDDIMLSSGTEPSFEAAVVAAERVATRVAFILTERRRVMAQADNKIANIRGAANGQPLPYSYR